MEDFKVCERCHKLISDINTADWYSHIRIKYCPECRAIVTKEQAAERFRQYKQRKKDADKIRKERIRELELENQILRNRLKAIWEEEENPDAN